MVLPPAEVTLLIMETASDALEKPMEDLPQLSKSVEIDAVNALISDDPMHEVTIIFSYAGLRVVIYSGGTVYVHPIHEDGARP